IAMDLANTAHLVGTYQEGQFDDGGALDADFTTSLDDGKTWTNGNLGGLTTATGGLYARAGNPRVVFGLNGAVYIVSQVIDPATAQVTPDGVKAIAPTPMVQPNGNLTIHYSQPSAGLETVQTSSNGGASFAAPIVVHDFVSTEMPGMFTGNALGIGDAAVDPT